MIQGMTGFGSANISSGKYKGQIEIKSQNHRYLDIVYYLPVGFSSYEEGVRQLLSKVVSRGRVTVILKITDKPQQEIVFHRDAVKEYLKHAKELSREFGFKDHLTLSDLIRLPGVVEAKETRLDVEEFWPIFEKGFHAAVNGLLRMRAREGACLAKDLSGILKRMHLQLKKIDARTRDILKQKKKELTDEEFLSLQKGNNISEEVTRLGHYIDEYKILLKSDTGVGKKLDFVAQEMQRETNTIGSKVQDKEVSNAVITLKSKIEKLREQAQNIE